MRRLLLALVLPMLGGCALLGRSDALDIRYFDAGQNVTRPSSASAPSAASAPGTSHVSVRIGTIASSAALHERLVVRTSAREVGFYELSRWTERPEAFLARAIARVLFEERRFTRVLAGSAPTLDVDLAAFEEVRMPGLHAGRVTIHAILSTDARVLYEETITMDRPISTTGRVEDAVTAIGEALDAAVERVADSVQRTAPDQ